MTKAYRRGFPSTAKQKKITTQNVASQFFKRPNIQARIAELLQEKADVAKNEFAVDAAYVLRRLVEAERLDVLDILDEEDGYVKPIREWPVAWRQYITKLEVEDLYAGRGDERLKIGILKKIQWPDKLRALELLGKHVNVSAFKEVQEHTGPGGGPLRMITGEMTPQQAAETYADTLRQT